jgi:23S rRNA (uracil1939-C5)-methyltransferase
MQNAAQNNLKNITFLCGDVLKLLHKAELIITDPPRAGIMPKSLEEVIKLKAPNWIYVSCNPSTLARDLKIAAQAGYKIKKIQPVDMFPQTYHVETVVLLTF